MIGSKIKKRGRLLVQSKLRLVPAQPKWREQNPAEEQRSFTLAYGGTSRRINLSREGDLNITISRVERLPVLREGEIAGNWGLKDSDKVAIINHFNPLKSKNLKGMGISSGACRLLLKECLKEKADIVFFKLPSKTETSLLRGIGFHMVPFGDGTSACFITKEELRNRLKK